MNNQSAVIVKDVCAWPNLFHIDASRVGAVIFNRPSHGLEEGSLELWNYDIAADSWHYLSTPCPNLPGQNRMHSCCGVDTCGAIHVLSTGFTVSEGKLLQLESMWHSVSTNEGRGWKITRSLAVEGLDSIAIPHGSILCDENGQLHATVYYSHGKGNPSYTWMIHSDDSGVSWKLRSRIGDGDTNEAHLVKARDLWFAAVRTHRDHHTRLFQSTNPGTNWQDLGPLTLPMQHPGHLVYIGNNGILLTYGIRNKGLMAIGARISTDCGKTWQPPVLLYQFPNPTSDCGYPSSVMLDNDRILTGYYSDASTEHTGYHFGTLQWNLADYLSPRQLRSISNGYQMQV